MKPNLTLGTVRFGSLYGINNNGKLLQENDVFEILDLIVNNNLNSLDTADSYFGAIDLIAKYNKTKKINFDITTKLVYNPKVDLVYYFNKLVEKLSIKNIHTLLLHDFNDLIKCPEIIDILYKLKDLKIVNNIGVSIYTQEELLACSRIKELDTIQTPFNLLDNKRLRGKSIEFALDSNKKIQTRSVFLQGLFFKPIESLPKNLIPLKTYIKTLNDICHQFNINITDLALMYSLYSYNFDSVLIGVEDKLQLLKNLNIYQNIKLNKKILDQVNNIEVQFPNLLNPKNWK